MELHTLTQWNRKYKIRQNNIKDSDSDCLYFIYKLQGLFWNNSKQNDLICRNQSTKLTTSLQTEWIHKATLQTVQDKMSKIKISP